MFFNSCLLLFSCIFLIPQKAIGANPLVSVDVWQEDFYLDVFTDVFLRKVENTL